MRFLLAGPLLLIGLFCLVVAVVFFITAIVVVITPLAVAVGFAAVAALCGHALGALKEPKEEGK